MRSNSGRANSGFSPAKPLFGSFGRDTLALSPRPFIKRDDGGKVRIRRRRASALRVLLGGPAGGIVEGLALGHRRLDLGVGPLPDAGVEERVEGDAEGGDAEGD